MGILRDATLHFINQFFPSLSQTLHVSLSRGHVDSTDVVISKSDPISICNIPLQIVGGTLSGLSLQLPWMSPRTAKFNVRIKSVHIHLAEIPFPNSQQKVFRALSDEILRRKFRNVAEAERNHAQFGGHLRNFLSQVLERVELLVQDFTLVVDFADGSVGIFTIAKLRVRRSEAGQVLDDQSPTLLVAVEGVSAIIRNATNDTEHPISIPEFSATLRIKLAENNIEADLDISQIVQIFIGSSLREWLYFLRLRQRKWILAHKWGRPACSAREDAASWIRYAFRRVSVHRGLQRVRFDVGSVRRTMGCFTEYKILHVKRLHKLRLSQEEINRIAVLEGMFDAEMILLLRQAGKREVDADEISQFGKSEWLRWVLFGRNISYEREKLATDLTQSLEPLTDSHQGERSDSERRGENQRVNERFAFHFRLIGLTTYVCTGDHDMTAALTDLGFSIETNSNAGQFNAKLSLESLVSAVDGDIAVQKAQHSTQGGRGTGEGALLDASLSSRSSEISIIVNLHSLLVLLHPKILSSYVVTFQRWTMPLPFLGFDQHEDQIPCSSRDIQSPFANFSVHDIRFTAENTSVFLLCDGSNHDSEKSDVVAILRQVEIRLAPHRASLSPEVVVSLSLQLSEVSSSSAVTDYLERNADLPLEEYGKRVLSFSTDFGVRRTPVLTIEFTRADGFVDLLTISRLSYGLYMSIISQITAIFPKEDRDDGRAVSESGFEVSGAQKHMTKSGLQLEVSSLNVNMKWGEGFSRDTITAELRRLEICLSPMSFCLVSLRVEIIHLSSSNDAPILLQIEPTAGFQHALLLKRDCLSRLQGDFFEVLIGDVTGRLSPDAIFAVVAPVFEMISIPYRLPSTTPETGASQPPANVSEALFSLFAASLRIKWSAVWLDAEISCFDIQATAEANRISGSFESVALTEVDANGETASTDGIIVQVSDGLEKGIAPVRFLYEPSGFHVCLNNLIGSARRSFWEPLVSSIADTCETIAAQVCQFYQKHLELRFARTGSEVLPVTIEGSEVTVLIGETASRIDSLVYADIHRIIVFLRPGLLRISLRQTSALLENSSQRWNRRGMRILSVADCEISHQTKLLGNGPESSSLASEVWELGTLGEFAIALSPKSIFALRNAIHDLLSPVHWEDPSSAGRGSTDLVQDTAVDKRFHALFNCSIPLLRVSLGADGLDPNFEPFASLLGEGLSMSIADVGVVNSDRGCDVVVLTLLTTIRTLKLFRKQRSSPDSLRIVIGEATARYPQQNLTSRQCKGVSVRVLFREDQGHLTAKCDINVSTASVMHDPELYQNVTQFMTRCLAFLSASNEDTPGEGEQDNGEKSLYRLGAKQETSESQRRGNHSATSTTFSGQRKPPSDLPLTKVTIILSNFTYLCSFDQARDATLVALVQVRKASGALVMSSVAHQIVKSTIRLDIISCFAEDTARGDGCKDASFEHRTSQELSDFVVDYMHVPMLLSPSIVLRAVSHSSQKLMIKTGFISVTFSNSLKKKLTVSIGNVSAEAAVESLIHLFEVMLSFSSMPSGSFGTSSSTKVQDRFALRVFVHNASVKLSLQTLPVANHERNGLNAIAKVSVKYITEDFLDTSEGSVKLSLEVTDNSTGHGDMLISPCKINYRIVLLQHWSIEIRLEQLLRMSCSPLSVRMISYLSDALHKCTAVRSASNTAQMFPGWQSRLNITVHGVAVRCLSDTPRVQVLRLLLGEIRFEVVLNESLKCKTLRFRIRDYVLEDTISWRLFRDDEKDPTSRRWERIVSSMRGPENRPVQSQRASTSVLQFGETDLDNVVYSMAPRESLLHSAFHCQCSWHGGFQSFEGLLSLSGVHINLDLAVVPIIKEWWNSLLPHSPARDGSRSNDEDKLEGNRAPRPEPESWVSQMRIEPLTITGSIRAMPRRLQQSILERMLTSILDVEAVRGISFHLPSFHFRGEPASFTTVIHNAFSEYSHYAMSRQFLSGFLAQSGKLTRLAKILALSFLRRRPYNPLRLSTDKPPIERRNQSTSGLLGVLDSAERQKQPIPETSRSTRPLVIQRIDWIRGVGVVRDKAPAIAGAATNDELLRGEEELLVVRTRFNYLSPVHDIERAYASR